MDKKEEKPVDYYTRNKFFNIKKLFHSYKSILFFGYGSLMYPEGINRRSMEYIYYWKDLRPAVLTGYERGMFASFGLLSYYGLINGNTESLTQGAVLPIHSFKDFISLMLTEGVLFKNTQHNLYNLAEVSEFVCLNDGQNLAINPSNKPDIPVLVLTNNSNYTRGIIPNPIYVVHVWNGITKHGKRFKENFLKTGGMKPTPVMNMLFQLYLSGAPIDNDKLKRVHKMLLEGK